MYIVALDYSTVHIKVYNNYMHISVWSFEKTHEIFTCISQEYNSILCFTVLV